MTGVKSDPNVWSSERLAKLDKKQLETLRENAFKAGVVDLVERCDQEFTRRAPAKAVRAKAPQTPGGSGDFVSEYHFVCAKDRGVADDSDGRFWSGSWVVAQATVEASIRYGALLALHEHRAEPSYRQGEIVGWRKASREMIDKDNVGIEFLVRPTLEPLPWVGRGAAEKGYRRAKLSMVGSS